MGGVALGHCAYVGRVNITLDILAAAAAAATAAATAAKAKADMIAFTRRAVTRHVVVATTCSPETFQLVFNEFLSNSRARMGRPGVTSLQVSNSPAAGPVTGSVMVGWRRH